MTRLAIDARVRLAFARVRRVRRAAVTRVLGSRLLAWSYGIVRPQTLLVSPIDLRSRDLEFWPEIKTGVLGLAGVPVPIGDGSPFDVGPADPRWLAALHGFDWLRHIEAVDDPVAEAWARGVVAEWLDRRTEHPAIANRPEVRARRLISWLAATPVLLTGADDATFDRITRAIVADLLRLQATWRGACSGTGRLTALTALALARLAIEEDTAAIAAPLGLLCAEIDRQVLPDGGHVSRNPAALLDVLLDWLPLTTCLAERRIEPPRRLTAGISRAIGMLRYLRHADGTIARFNGMGAADPSALAIVMAYDELPTPTFGLAPASRYARLTSGAMVALLDAGGTPPMDLAGTAHAGCLSMEVMVGSVPLLVNAGAPGPADAGWRPLSRATASHSTACLGETSSAVVVREGAPTDPPDGLCDGLHDGPALALSGAVTAVVTADARGVTFEGSHEGYAGRLGLLHCRRVRLSANGNRLDVVDRFAPARRGIGAGEVPFAVHLHLHPSATVAPAARMLSARDQRLVLTLADGSLWQVDCAGARVAVEESTWLAGLSGPRHSLQIVLRGATIGGADVTWSITSLALTSRPPLALAPTPRPTS